MKGLADSLVRTSKAEQRPKGLFILGLYEKTLDDKVAFFRKAIALDPQFSDVYNARGTGADADIAMAKNQDEKIRDKMRKARLER